MRRAFIPLHVRHLANSEEGGPNTEGDQKKEGEGQEAGEKVEEGGETAEEDKEMTYEEYMALQTKVNMGHGCCMCEYSKQVCHKLTFSTMARCELSQSTRRGR